MKNKSPRKMSIVTCTNEFKKQLQQMKYHPFYTMNTHLIFLGEIVNMPGHCVLVDLRTNQIHSCYHTSNFRECTEEEI